MAMEKLAKITGKSGVSLARLVVKKLGLSKAIKYWRTA